MFNKIMRFFENGAICVICRRRCKDILFEYEGTGICSECHRMLSEEAACDYYDTQGVVKRLFAPFEYKDKIRKTLTDMKFNGFWSYAKPVGELIADVLPDCYDFSVYDMIIPVPLHEIRLKERGYNQAELIAEPISERLDIELANDVLFRIKNTKRQMTLSNALRQKNLHNAFYAVEEYVRGKRIILVDDIYTTGSTLKNCSKELLLKGAVEVSAIAVCENFKRYDKPVFNIRIPVKDG